jgi:tetratricopeptide (TPR) repeat protein
VFRAEALGIAILLVIGAVGGLLYNWPRSGSPPPAQDLPDAETVSNSITDDAQPSTRIRSTRQSLQPSPSNLPQSSKLQSSSLPDESSRTNSPPVDLTAIEMGDQLLLGGNYLGAIEHYEKLARRADTQADPSLLLRIALASELAGFDKQAEEVYRKVIAVSPKHSIQQVWSFIGTARIWESRREYEDAIALLSELHLLYCSEQNPRELTLAVLCELTDSLQKRLNSQEVVEKTLAQSPMEYQFTIVEPQHILDTLKRPVLGSAPDATTPLITVLQNPQPDVSLIQVDARIPFQAMLEFVRYLASQTGLEIQISSAAQSIMIGRSVNAHATAMPVAILLDELLEPVGLTWDQQDRTVVISSREELKRSERMAFDLQRVQRVLHQIQFMNPAREDAPPSPERIAATINDANNSRLLGQNETAREKYSAARDRKPIGELNAKLYFNQASLEVESGAPLEALHLSYMALDQTLVPQLQAKAYATIAKLELQLGQTSKAITAAARGLRRADDREILSQNAMVLAKCYLLQSDPSSANQVLFEYHDMVVEPKASRLASVLSAFSRHQRIQPQYGLQDEGQRLVLALAALQPGDADSFVDSVLLSYAYASIGLQSKAIENLYAALQKSPEGYWRDRIRYELAKILYQASDPVRARQVLEGDKTIAKELRADAMFLHAQTLLALREFEDCESECRQLLQSTESESMRQKTLDLLGQSLTETGDHYSAALCFAGLLPESARTADGDAATTTSGNTTPDNTTSGAAAAASSTTDNSSGASPKANVAP